MHLRKTASDTSTPAPSHSAARRPLDRTAGAPLRVLQVVAEVTVHDAEAPHVRRPRGKDATDQEASGEEVGHLADGLVGRDDERAGDAETAVAAWLPKADQHLVE